MGRMACAPALRMLQATRIQAHDLQGSKRFFHSTKPQATDGVYKAITDMRVRTPWIEALRQSKKESTGAPTESAQPDLRPKRMSDSFVKFVRPQMQWLQSRAPPVTKI